MIHTRNKRPMHNMRTNMFQTPLSERQETGAFQNSSSDYIGVYSI